jgi:PAS domain S-box-containing protein
VPSQTVNFESLLENVADALVGVDLGGVIRYVNGQTEMLFGYDRDDLLGTPLESLVPESLREVHTALRQGYTAAPRSRTMGTDLRLSAGDAMAPISRWKSACPRPTPPTAC